MTPDHERRLTLLIAIATWIHVARDSWFLTMGVLILAITMTGVSLMLDKKAKRP